MVRNKRETLLEMASYHINGVVIPNNTRLAKIELEEGNMGEVIIAAQNIIKYKGLDHEIQNELDRIVERKQKRIVAKIKAFNEAHPEVMMD